MMRRIETAGGTLVGKVDRVARRVVWSLECEGCAAPIELDADTFQGINPPVCLGCGWRPEPEGRDLDGRTRWFSFAASFETVPARPQGATAA